MKQNLLLVLLSVVATLLLVVFVQNMRQPPVLLSQLSGGGNASVGPIGVATGGITGGGDGSAFWLYDPGAKTLLVYFLGNGNKLELRAVRNIEFDMKVPEFAMPAGRPPSVADITKAVGQKKKQP